MLDVEIVLLELSYASEIFLCSQIDVIVYWEVSVWKTRYNTLCCYKIVQNTCAFKTLIMKYIKSYIGFVTLSE